MSIPKKREKPDTRDTGAILEELYTCLSKHEKRLDTFLNQLEDNKTLVNPKIVDKYNQVQLFDKRESTWTSLGHIIEKKLKQNSVEFSTDKGYTLCLSCEYNGILTSNKKQ